MKLFDILIKWVEGLITSGKFFLFLIGVILYCFGFIFAIVGYIFQIGFKFFTIFLDESLFYSIRAYQSLKISENNLKIIYSRIDYYFKKFIEPLFYDQFFEIAIKPRLYIGVSFAFIKYSIFSILYYILSITIFAVSFYWFVTYIEVVFNILNFFVSLAHPGFSIFGFINDHFISIDNLFRSFLPIHIFNFFTIWFVRIFSFVTIFYLRYRRIKKTDTTLNLWMIIPYRTKNKNVFWQSQNPTSVKYRKLFIIIFIFLVVAIILIVVTKNSSNSIFKFPKVTSEDLNNQKFDSSNNKTLLIKNAETKSVADSSEKDLILDNVKKTYLKDNSVTKKTDTKVLQKRLEIKEKKNDDVKYQVPKQVDPNNVIDSSIPIRQSISPKSENSIYIINKDDSVATFRLSCDKKVYFYFKLRPNQYKYYTFYLNSLNNIEQPYGFLKIDNAYSYYTNIYTIIPSSKYEFTASMYGLLFGIIHYQ